MFKLPSPTVILAALVIAASIFGYGHHKGWDERDQEMQAEIATKNAESREREQKLNEELNSTSTQLKDANDAITEKQSALDRAIRAGRVRLPASSCVQASPSPSAASGSGNQAGSQPVGSPDRSADASDDGDKQTLAIIAAIVAQGDRNTQQLNACIDAYNAVREQVNAQGK